MRAIFPHLAVLAALIVCSAAAGEKPNADKNTAPSASVSNTLDEQGYCANAKTQAAMNECAGKNFKKSDAELKVVYNTIRARLADAPDQAKLLTQAHQDWLSFRNAECKFSASSVSGGSVYPSIYANCADRLTKKRIDDFKAYLACQEGDLSCPVPDQ